MFSLGSALKDNSKVGTAAWVDSEWTPAYYPFSACVAAKRGMIKW